MEQAKNNQRRTFNLNKKSTITIYVQPTYSIKLVWKDRHNEKYSIEKVENKSLGKNKSFQDYINEGFNINDLKTNHNFYWGKAQELEPKSVTINKAKEFLDKTINDRNTIINENKKQFQDKINSILNQEQPKEDIKPNDTIKQ